MAFTEHKITAFQKKLADLPDQPNLSAAELKSYFDSSPEELRQAVNGICTDAARLNDRVSGIVAETFGDSIPKTMLSTELQAEIDTKAEETTVAARLKAEQTARKSADEILNQTVAQKCEVYIGSYNGSGENDTMTVSLGFKPTAVLVAGANFSGNSANPQYMNLAVQGINAANVQLTANGFTVFDSFNRSPLESSAINPYRYIAFK